MKLLTVPEALRTSNPLHSMVVDFAAAVQWTRKVPLVVVVNALCAARHAMSVADVMRLPYKGVTNDRFTIL